MKGGICFATLQLDNTLLYFHHLLKSESQIKTSQGHQNVTLFIKIKIHLRLQVFYEQKQL